jgi:predicted transcriptional regulator
MVRLRYEVPMSSAKAEVEKLLEKLPEDASFDDIQYHIYVRQKLARGLADIEAGRIVDDSEVERRLARWLVE